MDIIRDISIFGRDNAFLCCFGGVFFWIIYDREVFECNVGFVFPNCECYQDLLQEREADCLKALSKVVPIEFQQDPHMTKVTCDLVLNRPRQYPSYRSLHPKVADRVEDKIPVPMRTLLAITETHCDGSFVGTFSYVYLYQTPEQKIEIDTNILLKTPLPAVASEPWQPLAEEVWTEFDLEKEEKAEIKLRRQITEHLQKHITVDNLSVRPITSRYIRDLYPEDNAVADPEWEFLVNKRLVFIPT